MKRETITIRETPLGWLNKHTGHYHKSAVLAQKSVMKSAKASAASHGGVITVITWEPTTESGYLIVRALTSTRNPAPSRTFIPPQGVADEAQLGLAIRAEQPPSERCCTAVGLRRAVQLSSRQPVSVRTLKRMRSYFQRHAVDAQGARWDDPRRPSKGRVAWMLWGGDAGRRWCNKVLDSLGE